MAMKGDRDYNETTDISFFWAATPTTAAPGGLAVASGVGSGIAMGTNITDDPNTATYATAAGALHVIGVLIQTVAPEMSTDRDFPNLEKNEIRPGDKCTLITDGFVVTDMISGTPAANGIAYLGASGLFATSSAGGAPSVGRFESTEDAGGFCKVRLAIPSKLA